MVRLQAAGGGGANVVIGQTHAHRGCPLVSHHHRILFLDEGTAHLDLAKEKEINARLRGLSITRISVVHRPEIMSDTDMILRIGQPVRLQPEGRIRQNETDGGGSV